ncbi:Receptor-like protein kinase [Morus notabilis]|uniref:Receptor-like protein kinase n=1 Tax=Morus notabilis TaxID=981085 RepID=W9SV49_9ROSA|nr:Receptor-like protein kinase [Morus notabilis]
MKFYSFIFLRFLCSVVCTHTEVYSLSFDGVTLLSLQEHWDSVPPSISTSWNHSDSTPCSWVGIGCDKNSHNVLSLNLSGYGISGQIGPEIGHLKRLQTLDLSSNSFFGSLPQELSNCSLLESLTLDYNTLSGEIPRNLAEFKDFKLV